jgi:hypothetical protein
MQGIMARMQRVSGNAHGRVSRVSQCIQLGWSRRSLESAQTTYRGKKWTLLCIYRTLV